MLADSANSFTNRNDAVDLTMALETTKLDVKEHLKTAENRAAYIEAAVKGNDPVALVSAIGHVAQSIGVREFAEQTGLSRSAVYKAFIHAGGNPTIESLFKALDVIGMQIIVKAKAD